MRTRASVLLAVAGSLSMLAALGAREDGASVATRSLPSAYAPGVPLSVGIVVTPDAGVFAYALEDAPPAGWIATNISGGGVWDAVTNKVKFGPFFDNVPRTLTYDVTPPADASGTKSFAGVGSYDGTNAAIAGASTIQMKVPLAFASAGAATFQVNSPGSFMVTATGYPTPALACTGTPPLGVTFLNNGDGTATLSGTPAAGSGGLHALTFTATNAFESVDQAFTLTVNQAPAITSANATTFVVGSAGSFTVTASGFPLPALTEQGALPAGVVFTDQGNGTASLAGTPAGGTGGTYPLAVAATNAVGPVQQAFTLTVNEAPAIGDVPNQTMLEDGILGPLAFTVGDVGGSVDALTVVATSSNEILVPNASLVVGGSGANRTVTITPTHNGFGSATITLTVSDGVLAGTDTFLLTVTAVNDPPMIGDVADQVTAEDTQLGPVAFTIGDIDTPVAALTVTAVSNNQALVPNGNVTGGGANGDRTVTILPAANQFGTATITLTVSDGTLTASDTFVLTVTPVNDRPVAHPQSVTTMQDTSLPITVTGNDVETAVLTFAVTTPPAHGTLSGAPPNVTYTPAAGYSGNDSFAFTASDGSLASLPATVSITVTPRPFAAHFDFNGDGRADILWRNRSTGEIVTWLMNGPVNTTYIRPPTQPDPNWRIAAAGDFNGDGRQDLVWRHTTTGANEVWLMNGAVRLGTASLPSVADVNWRIAAADDFTGDGKADLLWRHALTGENAAWLMNGLVRTGTATLLTVADRAYEIAGTGDFDGDGDADIVWHNRAAGDCVVWYMQGTTRMGATSFASVTDVTWRLSLVADFDGDGKPDLLWRNTTTGENVMWLMQGLQVRSNPRVTTVDAGWDVLQQPFAAALPQGSYDFSGDGKPDIFFRGGTTGENIVWYMNNAVQTGYGRIKTLTDPSWKGVAVADFDGNGKPDVLWRNVTTGENIIWYLNGVNYLGYARVNAVTDLNWQIVGAADFTGDGKPDIVWRNPVTGENLVWHMSNAVQTGYTRLNAVAGTAYQMVALADFTGDGKTDILWRRPAAGECIVWQMNGLAYAGYRMINRTADATWQVGMAADFNADGKVDVVWRNATTGENIIWYLNGTSYAGYARLNTVTDPAWKIVPGQR